MANNKNGPDLSGEAQRLIEAARGFDDPTAEDRERVRSRWLASIAAGAGLSALGTAARAGGGVGWGMKAAGVIAALTVGGLAFYTLIPSPPPAPDAPSAALPEPLAPAEPPESQTEAVAAASPDGEPAPPAPAPVAAAAPSVPPPPAVAPAPRATSVPARPVAKAPEPPTAVEIPAPQAAAAPSSQLSEELAVIAQVRRSVQGGQGASALALLTEYQTRFTAPILGMEAAALRVDALCQAGQQAAARAAAAEFEKTWPASPLGRRVAAACR